MSTGIYVVGGVRTGNKNLWVLSDDGTTISVLSSYDVGSVCNVQSIARGVDGSYYISTSSGYVLKYNSSFVLDTSWATNGSYAVGASVFSVAVDPNGYVAVGYLHTGSKTILLLDENGALVWSVAGQGAIYTTYSVKFGSDGHVFGCGSKASGVGFGYKYNRADGSVLQNYWTSSGSGYAAYGIHVLDDFSVIIAEALESPFVESKVRKSGPTDVQQWVTTLSPASVIKCLVVDGSDNSFVGTIRSNAKTLFKLDQGGTQLVSYDTGQSLTSVGVNLIGQILAGGVSSTDEDGSTGVFRVFDSDLQLLRTFSSAAVGGILAIDGDTYIVPLISDQSGSETVLVGESVNLSVIATGTPDPTYQWYKDGDAIVGETTDTLSLTISESSDGSYTCTVTNVGGTDTSDPIVLTVHDPPIITAQSGAMVIPLGTPATLFVTATGIPSPTYQWYRNGVAIFGATSSTYLFYATAADDASFTCIVTNVEGSVSSGQIAINVIENPYVYNMFNVPSDLGRV